LIGFVAGAAAYALAGFLIAPLAIRLWIESPNVSGPGCRLSVQDVYVNPFTMFLSLKDATLFEQESKLLVSVTAAEARIWSVDTLRAGTPGRDVDLRNLVVTHTQSGDPVLAAPRALLGNVTIGSGDTFIDAAHAQLERPNAAVTRDVDGIHHHPAWLAMPGDSRAGACISLDNLRATGGTLEIEDGSVTPGVQLVLQDIEAGALRKRLGDTEMLDIDVKARIGARGTISIEAQLRHPTGRHPHLFSMAARHVDLQPLSPYARRFFGRDVVAGIGNATLQQERHDAALRFDNHVSFDRLRLEDPPENATDDTLMLELALALAADAAGQSAFSFQGSVGDSPAQSVVSVFTDSLAAHFDTLAARPFGVLAEVAGEPGAVLDEVVFLPGSAEMAPAAMGTLALLGNALAMRPQLDLRVRPAYDVTTDRDAIAAQQVRLHIALATSAGAVDRGDATGPDFGDPRVRDILDEFAGARLSEARRRSISRGAGDETTRYRDIYLALVANERVSETVLRRLARFRARSLVDAFEREGIDRNRFSVGDAIDVTATDAGTVSVKLDVKARPALRSPDVRNDKPGGTE
jgi:hypothetical protein